MADQEIRLALGIVGGEQVDVLRKRLADAKEELSLLAQAFAKGELSEKEFLDSTRAVESSQRALAKALAATEAETEQSARSTDAYNAALKTTTTTTATATGGFRNLNSAMIQGSYAVQDFASTSGDLGQKLNSVSNNLTQVLTGLGPVGIGLSVISVGALVAYKNWDSLSGLWEDRRPIEGQAESLKGLTEALKQNEKATADLTAKGSLDLAQRLELNKLTEESVRLESELAAIRETEANKKRLDEFSDARSKERGGAVGKAVAEAGGFEDVVKSLVGFEQQFRSTQGDDKEAATLTKQFSELMNRALKGDEKAIRQLTGTTAKGIGGQNYLGKLITAFDPETGRQQKRNQAADQEEFEQGRKADKETQGVADAIQKANIQRFRAGMEAAEREKQKDTENEFAAMQKGVAEEMKGDKAAARDQKRFEAAQKAFAGAQDDAVAAFMKQQESQLAKQVTAQTGLKGDAADAIARRTLDYQAQGADIMQAGQMAMMDLANNQLIIGQRLDMLGQQMGIVSNQIARTGERLRTLQPRPQR